MRGEEKAEALRKLGVNILLFNTLDETEILAEAASEHDGKLIFGMAVEQTY